MRMADNTANVIQAVLGSFGGLLGAIIGFYFSEARRTTDGALGDVEQSGDDNEVTPAAPAPRPAGDGDDKPAEAIAAPESETTGDGDDKPADKNIDANGGDKK